MGKRLYARFIILLLAGSLAVPVLSQTTEIGFFHGSEAHQLRALPYTRPPYIALDDLFAALELGSVERGADLLTLQVNRRKLVIDLARDQARFMGTSEAFPIRRKEGIVYGRVDAVAKVFTVLYGKRMIYESTSRSMHLPEYKDVHITPRMRKVGDSYRLALVYSHPIGAARISKAGRNLILKIKASPIVWNVGNFQPNAAVTGIELYENLPDGTTEILIKVGKQAKKYNVEPYTPENPRTVIRFTGDFSENEDPLETVAAAEDKRTSVRRIVIDPGHGGRDKGAVGPSGLEEKGVTLDLAKTLRDMLTADDAYEVRLTREDDSGVSLKHRTGIANNFKADLFLSIHINAIKSQNAIGSETYYLSLDASDNLDLSHYQDDEEEEALPEGMGDDLTLMLWDMAHSKYQEDSFRVARYVQQELNSKAGIRSRGVKQAPLKVLKGALMPAVLVEAAFISNSKEEARLKDPAFRERIAEAIFRAIQLYDEDVQRRAQRPDFEPAEGNRP